MAPKIQPKQQPRRSARNVLATESEINVSSNEPAEKDNDSRGVTTNVQDTLESESLPAENLTALEQETLSTENVRTTQEPSTARRSVQRLASVRGQANKPASLKFQPKAVTRRSKEEREAQERLEEERRQARFAANPGLVSGLGTHNNRGGGGLGRGGLGRGGLTGGLSAWRTGKWGAQATGPLGGPSVKETNTKRGRGGHGMSTNTQGSMLASTSVTELMSTMKSKKEPAVKQEKDKESSTGQLKRKNGDARIKKENESYEDILSGAESDQGEGPPRVNINDINEVILISDEEDGVTRSAKGKEREQSPKLRPGWAIKPIRIHREEHHERPIPDGSSEISAKLRQRAKAAVHTDEKLFIGSDDESQAVQTEPKKARANPKGKDVEFIRDERKWKGVFQDAEDQLESPKVKTEPTNDDIMIIDAPLAVATYEDELPNQAAQQASEKLLEESLEVSVPVDLESPEEGALPTLAEAKRRKKVLSRKEKTPVFQTKEDKEEWTRYSKDRAALGTELASMLTATVKPLDTNDAMEVGPKVSEKPDGKRGLIYLFQLPPGLPRLKSKEKKALKPEKSEITQPDPNVPVAATKSSPKKLLATARAIKTEPKKGENNVKVESGERGLGDSNENAQLESDGEELVGKVGSLTIYENEHYAVTWGKLNHEISKGTEGQLLREVVISDIKKKAPKDLEAMDEDGEPQFAQSMGQLVGGFVVTPDWESLLKL